MSSDPTPIARRNDPDAVHAQLVVMGKMAAGKTESSDYLRSAYGAVPWTIAERIKQVAHALVDQSGNLDELLRVVLLDEQVRAEAAYRLLQFAEEYELEPGKPRRLYQEVGQILRDLHPSTQFCWEEELERRIEVSPSSFTVVDIRSKESYHFFVTKRHYRTLRIDAPLEVRKQRMLARDKHAVVDESVFYHQSETDVDDLDFEFVIDNGHNDHARLRADLDRVVAAIRR